MTSLGDNKRTPGEQSAPPSVNFASGERVKSENKNQSSEPVENQGATSLQEQQVSYEENLNPASD